eukprot:296848_1
MSEQLNFCLSTANDIDDLFDKYIYDIDSTVDESKNKIQQQFDFIIQQLNERKTQLNQQIDAWKATKIEQIKHEKSNIIQYKNRIQNTLKECNELVQNNDTNIETKTKISNISVTILDNKDYKKYQQTKSISNYLQDIITTPNITFQDEITCNNITSFGNIQPHFAQNMFIAPKIKLSQPIKQGESSNGYKVRLEWNLMSSNALNNDHNFTIKYQIITGGFDDNDEKKIDESDSDLYWETLKYDKIECIKSNSFAVNIMNKTFALNRKYEFKIEYMVIMPIHLKIVSNIEEIFVDTDDRPTGDIENIELECVAYRADNNGPPVNMLNNDDSYYWSAFYNSFKKEENDWIEFEMKLNDDISYFPLRFVILNYGGYQKQGVKHMSIKIGNRENNEWYEYNEGIDAITIEKTDEYQSFDISGINSKIIKNKRLTCIRLEFMENWGFRNDFGSKYAVKEFQMYGIKF